MISEKKSTVQIILLLILMMILINSIMPITFSKYIFEYEIKAAEIKIN